MSEIVTVGLYPAKHVFRAHRADVAERDVLSKQLWRGQVRAFFSQIDPCVVAMEAGGVPLSVG